jgi:ferric-dicitrate binding protein FerR (iron transport regulator)
MNKESTRLSYLLQRFNARTASQAELAELAGLLNNPEAEKTLQQYWERVPEQDQFFGEATSQQLLSTILEQRHKPASIRPLRRRVTWLAAAAILFLLIVGAWLYRPTSAERQDLPKVLATTSSVIVPGSNKAVLVLGDGTKILLDSARNGHLAAEGDATVTKTDGQVSYLNQQQAAAGQALSYNTLFTPKGGQYQVVLSDGTKVWMNAASSLRYPATFSGKDRVVTLTGEAYFEVAKDLSKPFKVVLNGMEVQVLGTHFNVMAYQNEAAIKTTLLEGAVNINGINSVMKHKGFELTLFFQGSQGNDLFNLNKASTLDMGWGLNQPEEVYTDHWTADKTNAKYPKPSNKINANFSTRFVEDGSYLKLKNIQLAYSLPVNNWKISYLKSAQLYVSAQNLIVITKYSGYDPEVNAYGSANSLVQGVDYTVYPNSKSITFGFRCGF